MSIEIKTIKFKRGTKANLERLLVGINKPLCGEPIYELADDSTSKPPKLKVGDGIHDYINLDYISGGGGPETYLKSISYEGRVIIIKDQDNTPTIIDLNDYATVGELEEEIERASAAESGLDARIRALESRGRFLSSWNASTGLPGDYPTWIEVGETYNYKTGDYYIVNTVGSNNVRPAGTGITRTSETTWSIPTEAETNPIAVNDQYVYTAAGWIIIHEGPRTVTWGNITGNIADQTDLQQALTEVTSIQLSTDTATNKVLLTVSQRNRPSLNTSASLKTINGEAIVGTGNISVVKTSLSTYPEVKPRTSGMSISTQKNLTLYVNNNGTPSRMSISELDYTRVKVGPHEQLTDRLAVDDILFEPNTR